MPNYDTKLLPLQSFMFKYHDDLLGGEMNMAAVTLVNWLPESKWIENGEKIDGNGVVALVSVFFRQKCLSAEGTSWVQHEYASIVGLKCRHCENHLQLQWFEQSCRKMMRYTSRKPERTYISNWICDSPNDPPIIRIEQKSMLVFKE